MTLAFPTGYGQFDSNKKSGVDYASVTGAGIVELTLNPLETPKESAQWFIPSAYIAHDARRHEAQREHGQFHWLTLDVDSGNLHLEAIKETLGKVAGKVAWIVYATRSARPDNRKWRALIPLAAPIPGRDYSDTQNAFFGLLEAATQGALVPDRALSRPGQLVYLPNRGAFYEFDLNKSSRLSLRGHVIARKRDEKREALVLAQQESEAQRRHRNIARHDSAADSPLEAFNQNHTLEDLMTRYGFEQAGKSQDWRSPLQTSNSFAVRCFGDYAVSLSGSDDAAGLGKRTPSGARVFDCFDLFVHFEHGGDFRAAVRSYGDELKPTPQDRLATIAALRGAA